MEKNPIKPKDKTEEGKKDEKPRKEKHFFERWKNPAENNMGNDISGDMKIANSNGDLEGGQDKRWHMEDDDQ